MREYSIGLGESTLERWISSHFPGQTLTLWTGLLHSVCLGFWHITLASDPRSFPRRCIHESPVWRIPSHTYAPPTSASLLSSPAADLAGAFGSFLPTLFFCYAFYRFAYRWVLPAFNNRMFERTIWFYGPFWVFILSNVSVPSGQCWRRSFCC